MTSERWRVIEELYHSASDIPDDQRNSFLERACGEDRPLLSEVRSLLKHGLTPGSVFDTPAIAVLAKAIAADAHDFPALLEGKTISHYRIIERIGRGGMGVVYKAEDLRLRRHVALKLLPIFPGMDREALKRFEREAQAASSLNHPNICTVYDVDAFEGLHFIAIELLDGETLKERIARGRLEVPEILGFGIEICEALEAAHAAGIIHRDIKPSNIVLTRRRTIKLLDFGVAKCVGWEPVRETETVSPTQTKSLDLRLTSPGTVLGTVEYMSPEQALGQEVDVRTDLFSLGAMLYEVTTGKVPFPGKDVADVLRAIHERAPIPIEQLAPRAPAELIRITKKALQKDRSLRYQSAADLRADLQILRTRLTARASKRRAWLAVASVTALLVLLVSGSLRLARVQGWIRGNPTPGVQQEIKSLAVLPLENLTGDASQEYFVDGMTDALITNLTKLNSLRVISRTSAMHYKGTRKPLREIARELNVNAVVDGSVARSGNRVRISAQLVDVATDRNVWGRNYERDLKDVLQLQNELSAAVAKEVAGKLTSQERVRFAQAREVKPEVYEAYLKGRYFAGRKTDEGLDKGIKYFQEAIRLDPDYAPAYAGLADTYFTMGVGWGGEVEDPEGKAITAARKAISLDESLAEAHTSLATVLNRFQQDWNGADSEFKRALVLNPNYAMAHNRYGMYFRTIGQIESACQEFRTAHVLDPLNASATAYVASCISQANHFDEAIRMMRDAIEMNPDDADLRWGFGELYERRAMFPQALEQYKQFERITGRGYLTLALLASAYGGWGKTEEAEQLLKELHQKFGEDNWINASIHSRMGRKEQAIRELMADGRGKPGTSGPGMSWLRSEWRFDPIRSDPRFQALEKRFNYPELSRLQ